MRLVISTIVVAVLATNSCFAKESHAQHGARASAIGNVASGKGATGANPAPSKAPIDARAIIAPPVLPLHGVLQQIRIVTPSAKTVGSGQASRSQASATTVATPIARNAIGQSVIPRKNFAGAQPLVSALQRPGAVPSPIIHGGTAAVSSAAAPVNVANATNRSGVNGATVIRPAIGPSAIGGPAQTRYGVNGTTMQNRH